MPIYYRVVTTSQVDNLLNKKCEKLPVSTNEMLVQRARMAAAASAKVRSTGVADRNRLIRLAYEYLNGHSKNKAEAIEAIKFLQKGGAGVSLSSDGVGPLTFLAKITGLTKQRIHVIVTDHKNSWVDVENKDLWK